MGRHARVFGLVLGLSIQLGCTSPLAPPAEPASEATPARREPEAAMAAIDVQDEAVDWRACASDWAWPGAEARLPADRVDGSLKARLLGDSFRMAAVPALRADPTRAGCVDRVFEAETVAGRIRRAAAAVGHPVRVQAEASGPGKGALETLCQGPCRVTGPGLERFQAALAPVLWGLVDALGVLSMYEEPVRGVDWWARHGGHGLLGHPGPDAHYNAGAPSDRDFLGKDKGPLYGQAVQLARALQQSDWTRLRGTGGLRIETPYGPVGVAGSGDDTHEEDWLLLVELGGDDVHLHSAGGTGPGRPLALTVDLGGDDLYAYPEYAGDEGRLAPDDGGRFDLAPWMEQASGSAKGRQGAAWFGIGMLLDLGGDDRYRSLRGSQGYGHHGIGLLFDGGGHDSYRAEVASQGTGQYGIGLLLDEAGDDEFEALGKAQGHGFVGGLGGLFDRAGDDRYVCASDPAIVYPSAQLPESSGVSLCQGAGFGFRSDKVAFALSGGVGVLIDGGGHDSYLAEVYAQGVGYWQGVGLLRDESGDDVYTASYYAMGSGVHYGVGVLHDVAGRDAYGGAPTLAAGTGHDYGLGVAYDEAGDDAWQPGSSSLGVGSCGGVGVAVDRRGDDVYAPGGGSLGRARAGRCPEDVTRGFFLDADGDDAYPAGEAGEGQRWGAEHPQLVGLGEDVSP